MSDWKRCEAPLHEGDERDDTVAWRDVGLLCDTCDAAFSDTRPLRRSISALQEELAQARLDHLGTMHEMAAEIERLREAFWAWESCALAAETDPEEIQDAEDLWRALVEIMSTPKEER